MIKSEGGKWVLYSQDGKKVLGRFASEAEAKKREAQVKWFKGADHSADPEGAEELAAGHTEIQTLIFAKAKYPSADEALAWCKSHDFSAGTSRDTEDSFRIRQKPPEDFVSGSFRTIRIAEGISAVIGRPRKQDNSILLLGPASDFVAKGSGRFLKDIAQVGKWVHPDTGQEVEFTLDRLNRLAAESNRFRQNENEIPFPDGHSFSVMKSLGDWPGPFVVEAGRLWGVVAPKGEEVRARVADGRIKRVSARIQFDHVDTKGNTYPEVLTHVCATDYPVLTGQRDFLALSVVEGEAGPFAVLPLIPADEAGGAEKGAGMDRKAMLASLAALSLSPEVLGLKEDAQEKDIFEALGKRTPPLDEKATKKVVDEALALVGIELKARNLKIEAGKVVELAAKPPAEETEEVKALRVKVAEMNASLSRQRIEKAKQVVALAVKDGRLPPAVEKAALQLLSVEGKAKAIELSADGKDLKDADVETAPLVEQILASLPRWDAKHLTQLSAEQKTKAEELSSRGAKAMRKAQGRAEPKKEEKA